MVREMSNPLLLLLFVVSVLKAAMFSLPPLVLNPQSVTPLDTVHPRFSLPQLNEDAPGVERLLGTLGRESLAAVELEQDSPGIDPVEKEVEQDTSQGQQTQRTDDDDDIWQQAGLIPPPEPVFQVRASPTRIANL